MDEWEFKAWTDGTQQWRIERLRGEPPFCYIERVVGDKSRRKRWRIVDRRGNDEMSNEGLYPPALSPPFKSLDAAKATFMVLLAAGQFD